MRKHLERRGEERRRADSALRSQVLGSALMLWSGVATGLCAPACAQATGTWETGFLHQHNVTSGECNDYLSAFSNRNGYMAPPAPMQPLGWGTNVWSTTGNFNAIHMALIPKGPLKGKVLVWNRFPVALVPGDPYDSTHYWTFQGWSIIDPDWTTASTTPRFRNFLLPIEPWGTTLPQPPTTLRSIFCSGHAWSQNGDLIVAGGATYDWQSSTTPPGETGAPFLFLFDPSANSQPFPRGNHTQPLYANELGHWVQNTPDLHDSRYYPTVTLSQRLARLDNSTPPQPPDPREVVMVSGGTDTTQHDPSNNYECWEALTIAAVPPFAVDPTNQNASLPGPVTTGVPPAAEILGWYPRTYLLSDGAMFFAGMGLLSSKVDLDTPASRSWDITVGRNGPLAWPHNRDYGCAIFFGSLGGLSDVAVRLFGGAHMQGTTDTAEFCPATTASAGWTSVGQDPAGPRMHANVVILPDASVVVIGGDNHNGPLLTTSVYRPGIGWAALPHSTGDSPTPRIYHATAVLLPDGRVFVGGGESHGTTVDYDIFRPHYLQGSPQRPSIVGITAGGTPVATDADGIWQLTNNQQDLVVECSDLEELDSISRVVLMAPGSTTHHSDMTARYVELPSSLLTGSNKERLFLTPDSKRLPRGYYMLFVLNSALIPSVASWVRIG